jgi:2-phosphosulfolactate phosphatase
VARAAWRTAGTGLPRLIRESVSGRELVDRGFPRDVDLAFEQEVSSSTPLLIDGAYRAA